MATTDDRTVPDDGTDAHGDGSGEQPESTEERAAERRSGDGHEGREAALEATLEEAILEGTERLERSWRSLLAVGMVGGIDVGFGVLALLVVERATGSRLLGALAFSIGFLTLELARSELFTENFLVPVTAVITHNARWSQVVRLWFGTALTNLAGGWVLMALVILAVPELGATAIGVADDFHLRGITAGTFASAVLAGAFMTLLTWMERGSRALLGKLTAAVMAAFVLAATPLLHSIVTSLEHFAALQGDAPWGYRDWFGLFLWASLGNSVGGLGLVTALRLVQVGRQKILREQEADLRQRDGGSDRDGDADHRTDDEARADGG